MSLTPGVTVANYEIRAAIGKGGMGEVWQARDSRLGRDVAIKTLPPALATDADRIARFEREAKVLASLNHPNIAGIMVLPASRAQADAEPATARIHTVLNWFEELKARVPR